MDRVVGFWHQVCTTTVVFHVLKVGDRTELELVAPASGI
jgi:hypothetical protein